MKKFKANANAFFKTLLYMLKTLKTPRALISFGIAIGTLSGAFMIAVGFIIRNEWLSVTGTAILTGWNVIPFTPLFGLSFMIGVLIQRYILLDTSAIRVKQIVNIYKEAKEKYYLKVEESEDGRKYKHKSHSKTEKKQKPL